MIVVDTNILFPYIFQGQDSALADRVWKKDRDWRFPQLWRYEFSSALLKYVRAGKVAMPSAELAYEAALKQYCPHEREPEARRSFRLAKESGLSAYDSVYLSLAEELNVTLVSLDKAFVSKSGGRALLAEEFLA